MRSDYFPEHQLTKGRLRELVRQYWPVVATVFVAGTMAMYVVLPLFFTDLYESDTNLLVRVVNIVTFNVDDFEPYEDIHIIHPRQL